MLHSCYLVAVAVASAVAAVDTPAQRIQWLDDAEQGAAKAKQTRLPILFFIAPPRGDDRGPTPEAPQVFRDPTVSRIILERFVPVRLRPSTASEVLLKQLQAAESPPFTIVIAAPWGKRVDAIPASEVAEAKKLAERLTELFRKYRTVLFQRDFKATFEDPSAKLSDIVEALKAIQSLVIVEADEDAVALLGRDKLAADIREQVYVTLAALSTERSASVLLEAALRDEAAARALAKCTPAAAEALLPALQLEDRDRLILAYQAVTKICHVEDTRPQEFWSDSNKQVQLEEIDRVRQAVSQSAAAWRHEYAPYR